eukprot:s1427_g12.t1
MFIVLKSADAVGWIVPDAGEEIQVNEQLLDDGPTHHILKGMTKSEMTKMARMCHTRLKHAGSNGKDNVAIYLSEIWDTMVERLTTRGILEAPDTDKKKLMFVVNDNGMVPYMVSAGMVLSTAFLNSLVPVPTLSEDMAKSLTVEELKALLTRWGQNPTSKTKPRLVQDVCAHFAITQAQNNVAPPALANETDESDKGSSDEETSGSDTETEKGEATETEEGNATDTKEGKTAETEEGDNFKVPIADYKDIEYINKAKADTQILQLVLEQKQGKKLFIYNFKKSETFLDVANAFQKHTGYNIENAEDITFRGGGSFIEPYESITSVRTSQDVLIHISARLRGGAKKVAKGHLKKRSEVKTTANDELVFKRAYEASLLSNTSTTFDLKNALKGMEAEPIKKMKDELKTVSRSHSMAKIEKMTEHLPHFVAMKTAYEKLETAMTAMKELVSAHIDEAYTDDNGKVDFGELGELLASTIALKEASAVPATGVQAMATG